MIESFKEFTSVEDTINKADQAITQDVYDRAEYFSIVQDEETFLYKVNLYDEDGNVIVSFEVEDYDTIVSYLDDAFEIEPEDYDDYEDLPDDYEYEEEMIDDEEELSS